LEDKLRERARSDGISITQLVRNALEDYLSVSNNIDWTITACNLFNVNIMQLQYAMRNSRNVAEFMLYVAGLGKRNITVIPAEDYIIKLKHSGKDYTVKVSRDLSKEAACTKAIEDLHKALFADFDDGFPTSAEIADEMSKLKTALVDKSQDNHQDDSGAI